MKRILAALFFLPHLASAAPSMCSDVFAPGSEIRAQLAELRLQIGAGYGLDRALYQEFQQRFVEAKRIGVDLSKFEEQVQQLRGRRESQSAKDSSVRRQVQEREQRALNSWRPNGEVSFPAGAGNGFMNNDFYVHISDKQIQSYDLSTKISRTVFDMETSGRSLVPNFDRTSVATTTYFKGIETVSLYEFPSGKRLWQRPGGEPVFSGDGKKVALLTDHGILVVDAKTGAKIATIQTGLGRHQQNSISFTADGQSVIGTGAQAGIGGNGDATARLYPLANPTQHQIYQIKWASLVASANNGRVAIAGRGNESIIRVFEKDETGKYLTFRAGPDVVTAIAFSSDNQTLFASTSNAILVWDVASGVKLQALPNRGGLAFSEDGSTFASMSNPRMIGSSMVKFYRFDP